MPCCAFSFPKLKRTKKNKGEWTMPSMWEPIASTLDYILRAAGEATSGVPLPGLEVGIKGVIYVLDSLDRAKENQANFRGLRSRLETCRCILDYYGSESLPPRIQDHIKALGNTIQTACDEIPRDDRGKFIRVMANTGDASLFQTLAGKISSSLEIFQTEIGLASLDQITELLNNTLLDKLPKGVGARSNLGQHEHETAGCLPDTRVEIIKDIKKWVCEDKAPPVFWLNSTAGVGKSTVAHSIAHCYWDAAAATKSPPVLAGDFFFSRDKNKEASMNGFFSTLVRLICHAEPRLVRYVGEAITRSGDVSEWGNHDVFSRLLVEPLRLLQGQAPNLRLPMVVVIDAMDECPSDDVKNVLQLLLGLHKELHKEPHNLLSPVLKFLITSRPEPYIKEIFDANNNETPPKFRRCDLGTNIGDVDAYLRNHFTTIRRDHSDVFRARSSPWPETEEYEELSKRTAGLFIYASTIIKFVADEDENPIHQLKLALDSNSLARTMYGELDSLYSQILSQVRNWERVRKTLGAITQVVEPLSVQELTLLLKLDEGDVRRHLRHLHSVLIVPTDDEDPIRLAHPSFYDFLTTQERSGNWYLDILAHREMLAAACMKIMTDSHKEAWHTTTNANFAQRRLLQYVCKYWHRDIIRLHEAKTRPQEEFQRFMLRHWFEASTELEVQLPPGLSEIFKSFQLDVAFCQLLCYEIYEFSVWFFHMGVLSSNCNYHPELELFQVAVDEYPGDPPHRFKIHYASAQCRYAEWNHQIKAHETALQVELRSLPGDHEDNSVCLLELALCNQRTNDQGLAVLCFQDALAEIDDFNKPACYNSYGVTLHQQFHATNDISLLNQAIETFQQALSLSAALPTMISRTLNNLGIALITRFNHLHRDEDEAAALAKFQDVENDPLASPYMAFVASFIRAQMLTWHSQSLSLSAYQLALKKSLRISRAALPRREVMETWQSIVRCGQQAAIVAINEGDMWGAVECFDSSCTTFWKDGLEIDKPFFLTSETQAKLDTIATFLEHDSGQWPMYTFKADHRILPALDRPQITTLMLKYDDLLQLQSANRIGMMDKFNKFKHDHPEVLQEGSRIILLCADEKQAFALVLGLKTNDVQSVSLAIDSKCLKQVQDNPKYMTFGGHGPPPYQKTTLQEAWNLVANPIITALGLKPGMPLTRTWWCASVPFMGFPINAATNYDANPPEHLDDYMISSFLPNLSSLVNHSSRTGRSGLFCPPSDTRNSQTETLREVLPEQLLLIPQLPLDTKQILPMMRACSGVHFPSCFTIPDSGIDVSAAASFTFGEGDQYVGLRDLLHEPSLPSFAYVPRCFPVATSWSPMRRLPYDLLAVGFSSVVGTQGYFPPEDSAAMASAFYSALLELSGGQLDFHFAAHALHAATIKIRKESGDEPNSIWSRMIHVGF